MKFGRHYFKEPADQAWQEFKAWADKWVRDDVKSALLVLALDQRSCAITLSNDPKPLTRTDRLRLVEAAADAIISNRIDSEHIRL